ncbi:MAG: DUF6268 family outer membrane beta-barrel protein [Pirellulales bacterium]
MSPYSSNPSVAPTWDPYSLPGAAGSPPPALPAYGTQPTQPSLGFPYQDWTAPQTRLVQGLGMRYTWIRRGGGDDAFGVQDVDLTASLAFPFFFSTNIAPFLFTPGFSFHFLQGPNRGVAADIPGTVYDAYGQLSWKPQFNDRLGADLALSVGVYSDFSYADHTSIRVQGRGLGTWTFSPSLQLALGVVYLDRLDIKILPAGGLIWRPHDDARFELLFPQPKLSQRIVNWNNYDVWGYIGGEYGGGQWSIAHSNGAHDVINYNDFRIFLGFEALGPRLKAHFDVGYVFHREILLSQRCAAGGRRRQRDAPHRVHLLTERPRHALQPPANSDAEPPGRGHGDLRCAVDCGDCARPSGCAAVGLAGELRLCGRRHSGRCGIFQVTEPQGEQRAGEAGAVVVGSGRSYAEAHFDKSPRSGPTRTRPACTVRHYASVRPDDDYGAARGSAF